MTRALFKKTGRAVWISHLDLMRLFQRAFKRAGLHLTHTQGFNPRPSVSIALPLSVGVESVCELLDFELEDIDVSPEEIRDRLNRTLPEGVCVLSVYKADRKIKHIAYLDCEINLEYNAGVPEGAIQEIQALFSREILMMEKRGKNGPVQQDILPLIKKLEVLEADSHTLRISTRICCQNPSLNPGMISGAVEAYLKDLAPDFVTCSRSEVYDEENIVFR